MPPNASAPTSVPSAADQSPPEDTARFRQNLVKVMGTQVVALLALWWLQARYGS